MPVAPYSTMLSLAELYFFTKSGEGEDAQYTYRFQWSTQSLISHTVDPDTYFDADEIEEGDEDYIIEKARHEYVTNNINDGTSAATNFIVNIYDKDTGNLVATRNTSDTSVSVTLDEGEYLWEVVALNGKQVIKTSDKSYICTIQNEGFYNEEYPREMQDHDVNYSQGSILCDIESFYGPESSAWFGMVMHTTDNGKNYTTSYVTTCGPRRDREYEDKDYTFSLANCHYEYNFVTDNMLFTNSGIYILNNNNWDYLAYYSQIENTLGAAYFVFDTSNNPPEWCTKVYHYNTFTGKFEYFDAGETVYIAGNNHYITSSGVYSIKTRKKISDHDINHGEFLLYDDVMFHVYAQRADGTICTELEKGEAGSIKVTYIALSSDGQTAAPAQEFTLYTTDSAPGEIDSDGVFSSRIGNCFCFDFEIEIQEDGPETCTPIVQIWKNGKITQTIQHDTVDTHVDFFIDEDGNLAYQGYDHSSQTEIERVIFTGVEMPEIKPVDPIRSNAKNDLDGDGLSDIILRHDAGFCGAWITTENNSIKWGNLTNVKNSTKVLGTGNIFNSAENGLDIFYQDGKTVGAWNVEGGKITGYRSVWNVDSDAMKVLGLGDFNNDGGTDLLLRHDNGSVGCYLTDGRGWNYFQSLGKEWTLDGVGDFNGDGRDDLILKHDAGFAGVWLTRENGTVSWKNLDNLKNGLEIAGVGDFNGDGTEDILLRKGTWVGAWLMDDGTIDSFIGIKNNLTSTIEQIGDFDGDGIDDLRIRAGKDLGVLYVEGADTTRWQYIKSVGTEWKTTFAAVVG